MDSKIAGKVLAVCISEKKGTKKKNVELAKFVEDFGIIGDGHAGNTHRQVSLLGLESINKMREKGLKVGFGDFAENITTEGIDLLNTAKGATLKLGEDVILEVTQIGKECHSRCAIYYQVGDCVMPKEGVFARVVQGGIVKTGDNICVG